MIVVDEVEIVNVKGDSVASEETLLALLETMKKMASSKGFDPKDVDKKVKDLANNLDSLVDIVDDNTRALEDNTDANEDNTDAVKKNTSYLASMTTYIVGSTLNGLVGFTNELLAGGDNLSDFAKHIPMIGSLIQPLTGYIDESISVFREMSQVGATFSGGLSEFRRIAGEAAMPLDEFRKLVQENSETLRIFGNDTAMGARNFAAMSNEFRKGPGRELLNIGFTSSDLNQTLLDYAEIQATLFGRERAQSLITTQNAGEFATQLQKLSAITGKRRDQIAEEMMQTASNARARMAISRMTTDEAARFQANIGTLSDPLKNVIIDMADSIPNDELSQRLMTFSDTFRDQASNIKNLDSLEMNNVMYRISQEIEASGQSFEEAFDAIFAGVPGAAEMFSSFDEIRKRGLMTAKDMEDYEKRNKSALDRNNSILQFGETLNQIRGDLQVAFINSGIFQTIEELVGNFTDALSDPATMSMIEDGLNTLASGLKTVITAIGSFINDLQYSSLGDAINAFLFGRSEEESKQRLETESKDLTSRIQNITNVLNAPEAKERLNPEQRSQLESERGALQQRLSKIDLNGAQASENKLADQRMSMLAELSALEERQSGNHGGIFTEEDTARVKDLRSQISEIDKELSQQGTSEGMFGGMLENLTGVNGVLAGGALATLVVGLGLALTTASLPAIAFGAAIGMAAGGVGYALNAVSNIMDSMTARTEATTDQLERLSNIPDENLHNAASGIERMKEALNNFNPSKMELLGDWIFGDARRGAIESTSSLIQETADAFNNLDTQSLSRAASGISILSLALQEFNQATAIEGVGDLASRLIGYQDAAGAIVELALGLSVIKTPENISAITESLPSIISAIDSFQSLTSISSLGEGVSAVLDSYSTVTDPLVRLISALAPIDGTKLTNVAPGIEAVSKALTVFKNSTGFSGLGDLVARWFSDDAMSVGANIKTIADDLSEIDANQLTNSSTAIVAMSNAFEAFSNADVDDITISKTAISRLQMLANSSTGLNETATSLERIAGVTNLRQNLDAINEGLDPSGIRTYTDAIDQLVERLNELNEVLAESNDTLFKDNQSAADVLGNIRVSTQGSSEGISQLNTMLSQMLTVLTQSKEIENKIERNTASLSSDTLSGRVSRMR